MLSLLGAIVKRETGWHTQLLSLSRTKAAKLLRCFSRAEFERCGSPRSSHKVMLNNRKPVDLNSPLVKCPDIHPLALPLASYVRALDLWPGCGHEDRGPSWPARH